jgi:hypothetical protein
MVDGELAALARYKAESQELMRGHRGLTWQLAMVDRELDRCPDHDRRAALEAQRPRITERLADTETRLAACRDRTVSSAQPSLPDPYQAITKPGNHTPERRPGLDPPMGRSGGPSAPPRLASPHGTPPVPSPPGRRLSASPL